MSKILTAEEFYLKHYPVSGKEANKWPYPPKHGARQMQEFAEAYAKEYLKSVLPEKYENVKAWEEHESGFNNCLYEIKQKAGI